MSPKPAALPRIFRAPASRASRAIAIAAALALAAAAVRLQGADGTATGQELVLFADGQLAIESQLEGAVDRGVATATYDLLTPNLLAIVRYPRKGLDPLPQQEIRYTFYFDRGKLVLNRDRETLVFRKVAPPGAPAAPAAPVAEAPPPAPLSPPPEGPREE